VLFAFLSTLPLTLSLAAEKSTPSVNAETKTKTKTSANQEDPGKETPPIQDNSFLIEEAYNQEFGMVQHINTFSRASTSRQWLLHLHAGMAASGPDSPTQLHLFVPGSWHP
jgi:hypothetical protein